MVQTLVVALVLLFQSSGVGVTEPVIVVKRASGDLVTVGLQSSGKSVIPVAQVKSTLENVSAEWGCAHTLLISCLHCQKDAFRLLNRGNIQVETETERALGRIKWFNDAKGYGFISWGHQDVFVHFSAIQASGFRSMREGQTVYFEPHKGQKGFQAESVQPLSCSVTHNP